LCAPLVCTQTAVCMQTFNLDSLNQNRSSHYLKWKWMCNVPKYQNKAKCFYNTCNMLWWAECSTVTHWPRIHHNIETLTL
jgi:hypothetical protein